MSSASVGYSRTGRLGPFRHPASHCPDRDWPAGYHPGVVTGSFTILRFPMNGGGVDSEPPTIYKEMYTGALYLDKPTEVDRFDAAFEAIWDAALGERSSRDLIAKTAEDMRHG